MLELGQRALASAARPPISGKKNSGHYNPRTKFPFTSEYDITASDASYQARKTYFSFNDKIQLQTAEGRVLAMIRGDFSPLRFKHDFNIVHDGKVYRFWCEKIWKQVYICEENQELFRLYEHKGLAYSIFQNDRQIAAFVKNRIVIGKGNKYELRVDSDANLIVILCMELTINASEDDDKKKSVTIDFGNLGPEDKPFDSNWEPHRTSIASFQFSKIALLTFESCYDTPHINADADFERVSASLGQESVGDGVEHSIEEVDGLWRGVAARYFQRFIDDDGERRTLEAEHFAHGHAEHITIDRGHALNAPVL
jgi:hypothetical protein